MGEYKKSEFIKGSKTLNCDSIESWKRVIENKLRKELANEKQY
jgi:hypothetical protein